MMQSDLFLGVETTDQLQSDLAKINAKLLEMFTTGGDYLTKITYEKKCYLGKFATQAISIESLKNLEANVTSLVKKLSPSYHASSNPPMIFGILNG